MDLFLPVLKQIFGRHLRLRHVVHDDGSESEVRYSLKQYGFQDESLPHPFLGSYKLDPKAWVYEREREEELMRSHEEQGTMLRSSSKLDLQLEAIVFPEETSAPRRISHWALISSLT